VALVACLAIVRMLHGGDAYVAPRHPPAMPAHA